MTGEPELLQENLTALFKEIVNELQEEPEFQNTAYYAVENGSPNIKVAVGNILLEYDLWKGLRNPAVVGLYPAGLEEIWEFYAHKRKRSTDESGRSTIFQVPQSFDSALNLYNRAVLISVMLPFSPGIINAYSDVITKKERGSSHIFSRMYENVNALIDKAVTRAALGLKTDKNVVLPMDSDTATSVSTEALPATRQGSSHGPFKGGNYPQKSVAALLGLGQFGIHRIIFRDESVDGTIQRVTGPLRSLVIFDRHDLITDSKGIIYVGEPWRNFLVRLYDFTDTDPEINKYRFCSYIPLDDAGCGLCTEYCPSGALANSAPETTGDYLDKIAHQTHRFWEGKLQFDYARCCEERGQMASLYPEWSCARGLSICASQGGRRTYAAETFYTKMCELTTV